MSKSLIITEKPSVAGDIAKALGGFKKGRDYYENEKYLISWAVGHLFELAVHDPVLLVELIRLRHPVGLGDVGEDGIGLPVILDHASGEILDRLGLSLPLGQLAGLNFGRSSDRGFPNEQPIVLVENAGRRRAGLGLRGARRHSGGIAGSGIGCERRPAEGQRHEARER